MEKRSVADIEGDWIDPQFESSLIARCRENWRVPICDISNYVLATFIRQQIALSILIPEAQQRLAAGYTDDSEQYDEELAVAVSEIDELAVMPGINNVQ